MTARNPKAIAPVFSGFAGGYFEMDWRDEYSSVAEIYDAALGNMPTRWLEELRNEVITLVRLFPSDSEVQLLLEATGADLDPFEDTGLTPSAWIENLSQWISARLAGR